jgi:membrane protein
MYTTVPNTRVKLHAALAGAFVAAVAWEAGKWGFTQYVRYSASDSYARLYGSIALVPLFLLWVYFTWLITLFGLQVAYQLQHVQKHTVARPVEEIEPIIVDPSAIMSIAGLLAERFQAGEPATAQEVAVRLAIQKPIATRMLDTLVTSSLAHKIDRGTDEKAYALARPPERIDAEELLRVGEGLAGAEHPDHLSGALRRTRSDFVHGKTLAALIATNGSVVADAAPPPPPPAPEQSAPPSIAIEPVDIGPPSRAAPSDQRPAP